MSEKFLIDTNIFVYAYDESDKLKQKRCAAFVDEVLAGNKIAYITNQILAEIYVVLTKKTKYASKKEEAQIIIKSLVSSPHFIKINYGTKAVLKAIEISEKYNIQLWDALIASVMLKYDIGTIYTENEKDFSRIPGLKVINLLK